MHRVSIVSHRPWSTFFFKQKDIEFVSISLVSLSAVLVVFLGIMLVVCDDYDNDVYL